MKKNSPKWLAAFAVAAMILSSAASAQAVLVDIGTFQNNNSLDASGLDLSVDITQNGSNLIFNIQNNSSIASNITSIFFEDGLENVLTTGAVTGSTGTVNFSAGGSPADLPGGNTIGFDSFARFSANSPGNSGDGIAPGENLQIVFGLESGKDISNVLDQITTTGRIAVQVHGVGRGRTISAVTNAYLGAATTPLPAAFWAGMVLLGFVGCRRKFLSA